MDRSSGVPTQTDPRVATSSALRRRRATRAVVVIATLLCWSALSIGATSLLLSTLGCTRSELHGAPVRPKQPAPEISAEDTSGGPFSLHEHRGRVTVLSFGYTSCPDVCPMTLSKMKEIDRRLG